MIEREVCRDVYSTDASMKKELLSPVGNLECLYSAIHNGCDAVYLGGKKFGARAFADNFTDEEMLKAIRYSHLYGVKIYVTINTLIYPSEMEECLNYIRFLHQNNVDAIIVQDLGLIKRVREQFPNLEIHASTQMHNHNQEQIKLLESLGVKRVVLARELSLEEIKNIHTTMEIEVFIHGALCICYSGQCLFSSLLLNRSGNRGSCAGLCRLPFKLLENDQELALEEDYILSTKELSTLDQFADLQDTNIFSFKIEGRMKSPSYVAYITRLYRMLLDKFERKEPLIITEEEKEKLKVLYNRGFTKGHLFHETNENLMNGKSPNHQGIYLGEVLDIQKDKIKIKLATDLHQEDGIRFSSVNKGFIVNYLYNEKGLLINSAKKGEVVFVLNKIALKKKGQVLKTIDYVWEKELKQWEKKKIPIFGKVIAHQNEPLKISFRDLENEVEIEGEKVVCATHVPTSKQVIEEKLTTLGNSPFLLKELEIEMDDSIFIPMSVLKDVKHKLVDALIKKREEKIPHPFLENKTDGVKKYPLKKAEQTYLHVLVRNEEQLKTVLQYPFASIYTTDALLYKKYKEKGNVYLRLPRVKMSFEELERENLLLGETGSLYKYGNTNACVLDYYFNVTNADSFTYLGSLGAKRITLSIELEKEEVKNLLEQVKSKEKVEFYLYGKPEAMVMKYCPLNRYLNKEKTCTVCSNKKKYALEDEQGRIYPLLMEAKENHLTHLFYYQNIDYRNDWSFYKNLGILHYRLEFFDETPEEIESILRKLFICKI